VAKTTKRAKRRPAPQNPFDDPAYRRRADAEDKAWAKRCGMVLHIRLQMLHKAETLARSIGPEGIAAQRLNLARDDPEFQASMAYYVHVRPSRPL
jgi:hypothetical protein